MRIIDLAEKQLNSEKLPKHIRYNDEDLYFDGVSYYDKQKNNDLLDILAMGNSAITHLYDEVEIIEEDEKIKKLNIELNKFDENKVNSYRATNLECDIANKINELIDAINELKKGE